MKRILPSLLIALCALLVAMPALAGKQKCVTIQDGTLVDANGNPLRVGFDDFGYNYQARMFNGTYDGADRKLDGTYWGDTGDYVSMHLLMKWSEDWLASVDCDGDGKLDRGDSGVSKGWLTNHVQGDYTDVDGSKQHYSYFCKIIWVGPGGSLWGQYEITEEIINDTGTGQHGLSYKAVNPGLGHSKNP
jgi:hypothetical protein